MAVPAAPAELHRCHAYVNVIVGDPVHVPGAAVRLDPSCAVPVIVGATVLAGGDGAAAIGVVASDVAELEPATFEAVTTARIRAPASAEVAVYVGPVAP